MTLAEVHQLRNILAIILSGIETGNLKVAKEGVHRAELYIATTELSGESGKLSNTTSSHKEFPELDPLK